MKIGVLALQGAVEEHIHAIEGIGAEGIAIKSAEQLNEIDGLILPGGESTAMRKLIDYHEMMLALKDFKKPILGTCAGLILLADCVEGSEAHIGGMNIWVRRNSFGRQIDSFSTELTVQGLDTPYEAVFIRAPHIDRVGEGVEVLAMYGDKIVLVQQGNKIGCAFHPELTDDLRIMELLKEQIQQSKLAQPSNVL